MPSLFFGFLFACSICLRIVAVVQLNEKNFDLITRVTTGENGNWLIRFYAPWCQHSSNMISSFEDAEYQLNGEVNVGEVDAIVNR